MDYDFDDEQGSLSEAFKILAALLMIEPDMSLLESFKEAFMVESSALLNDVSDDFHNLFCDEMTRLFPLESVYVQSAELPVLTENVADSLYNFYLREGLILNDTINISHDHISAELFFISYLIEAGRMESLKEFLHDHVLVWIPQFCDDMYERADTDFYQEVASITKDMVLNEYEQLS